MVPNVDEVHYVVETALSTISTAFNASLLYLIAKHSSYDGKVYQVCLAVDASLDLALGIISLLAKPCAASIGIYLLFSSSNDFQQNGLHVLQLNDWPYNGESPPRVFGSYITNIRLILWLTLWFISSGGGAAVVVICEVKMYRFFREYGNALSANTRRLHKQFHRALLAMAICPLMTTGLPVFFFIITTVLSLAPGPVSAFFTTALSSIAVFNPLTTIFFMPRYRDVVLQKFKKKRRSVADSTDVAGLEVTNVECLAH